MSLVSSEDKVAPVNGARDDDACAKKSSNSSRVIRRTASSNPLLLARVFGTITPSIDSTTIPRIGTRRQEITCDGIELHALAEVDSNFVNKIRRAGRGLGVCQHTAADTLIVENPYPEAHCSH